MSYNFHGFLCFFFQFQNPQKFQFMQSTEDGINCKQEVLLNGTPIWTQNSSCPKILTEPQQIYLAADDGRVPDAEVRNFKFFTHPV